MVAYIARLLQPNVPNAGANSSNRSVKTAARAACGVRNLENQRRRVRVSAYDLTCWVGYDLTCWSSAWGSWHGVTVGDEGDTVFEAVAGAVDGQDVAVVQEPVQDGRGQDVIA